MMLSLPSPYELKKELPLSEKARSFIQASREKAINLLQGNRAGFACITGPCSIHDPKAALEYAMRLKKLSQCLRSDLFLIMRVFCEKPRTRLGWKGIIYDPDLDGSYDLTKGLRITRELFLELAERGVPCATELLDPLIVTYFDDLLTWGFIGARTSASQPHRQMSSSLSFPVGFKNGIEGELDSAIHGIYAAKHPHMYFGINETGRLAALKSTGNPHCHLVLRGSQKAPNFKSCFVEHAEKILRKETLIPRILIDCSHGNSQKKPLQQREVFLDILRQREEGYSPIFGAMLESHLSFGSQSLKRELLYGVSITDACLSWDETEDLLLSSLPTSISSVQN